VWQRLGRPERLSSSLYFVGFVGGGLSFGLVGLVAGPLALGILSSLMGLLAEGAPGGNQFAGETDDEPEN
jgi:predicted PurR-regulated permease PerM